MKKNKSTEGFFVTPMPEHEGEKLDWSKGQIAVFPNLKPSTETISVRMPKGLLDVIRSEANRRDVPYQSLIKMALSERFTPARR